MLFYFPLLRGSFEAGNFHNNDGNWISEGMETGMEGKESKKTKGARRAEADMSRYMLAIKYKIKEKREAAQCSFSKIKGRLTAGVSSSPRTWNTF